MADTNLRSLVVFDLDGTLLRGPTVCEVLAQALGRLPRMQEIEHLKHRHEIAAAREEMAVWYAEVSRAAILDSLQNVQFAPGLAAGISLLQEHGVTVGIASITWRFAVQHLAEQLAIEHCLATSLQDSGAIDHVWPEHKAQWLLDLTTRMGVSPQRTAAIGDSAGDYEMLGVAGIPIFVGVESPPVESDWLHWPAANIEHVARHLIEAWALQPKA